MCDVGCPEDAPLAGGQRDDVRQMLRWGREIHAQRWTESKEKLIKQK
jgi:hypothetical protein